MWETLPNDLDVLVKNLKPVYLCDHPRMVRVHLHSEVLNTGARIIDSHLCAVIARFTWHEQIIDDARADRWCIYH